jgi:hypothetical protein
VRIRAALTVLILAGCGGGTGPSAGSLNVDLSTPYTDDGGLLLAFVGGPVDSIESAGNQLYITRAQTDSLMVIVAGQLTGGTIARIYVPDIRLAANYSAAVVQGAARDSYTQRDPASYSITVMP